MTEDPPTQVTQESDVFVSYSSQDAAVANAIVEALEKSGIECWIAPRDVTPGAHYADAIILAITGAKALVVVLSDSALASKHVGKEIERASSKGRPIIALRTSNAPLPPAFEYFLSESQWIDVGIGGVSAVASRLVQAVRSHLEPSFAGERRSISGPQVANRGKAPRRTRWILLSSVAALILGIGYFIACKLWRSNHRTTQNPVAAIPAPTISDKSIAVLPFVDMSEKHDQEYFSDGLSEELIDHLAHIPDLKVIARTSSFAFKGKNEDMRSIASKLGVANLLEGSVRKSGITLRITAQLIRASDGVHLWSETYDRKLIDIFKVQDEMSATVAKALNAAMNPTFAAVEQPASKGTSNLEAYNLFLQGNYFYVRSNEGDLASAVGLYQRALTLDPNYAAAWARLALVYSWQGAQGELTAAAAERKGEDAARRALAINPNSVEAYYARGNIFRLVAGDWNAAKSDYEKAVALDLHSEAGEYSQGYLFDLQGAMTGRFDEFYDWARSRLERDPLDTDAMFVLGANQQSPGHLEESAATFRRLVGLNPTYEYAWGQYAVTLLYMGRNAEALAMAQKEGSGFFRLAVSACIYWAMQRRSESDAALSALERADTDRNPYVIASIHAYRGEKDAAFAWLDRAYQQKRGSLEYLKSDLSLTKLYGDPRFEALLRKVKLSAS